MTTTIGKQVRAYNTMRAQAGNRYIVSFVLTDGTRYTSHYGSALEVAREWDYYTKKDEGKEVSLQCAYGDEFVAQVRALLTN